MTKEQKVQVVEEYLGIFDKPGVYLMDFKGFNVAEMTELRRKLRQANVSMRVVKNTLAKRALKQSGIESLDSYLIGPVGVVWSADDAVTPARVLFEFLKQEGKGTIKAGLIEGSVVDADQVTAISKLPTKHELQAKLASLLSAPLVRLARTINALPVKFAVTVLALRDSKQEK